MHSSECHNYAEQCLLLAQRLAPEHRKTLLDLADKWREAAAELNAREIRSSKQFDA
jgi:hypothetical protein